MAKSRMWFVSAGPDSRHLQDVTAHTMLRDALSEYEKHQGRARKLTSLDFEPWQVGTNERLIKEDVK